MYKYKTVFYKEASFKTNTLRKTNLPKFENLLNHYASDGWRLKEVKQSSQKTIFGGNEDAYIVIFEKTI